MSKEFELLPRHHTRAARYQLPSSRADANSEGERGAGPRKGLKRREFMGRVATGVGAAGLVGSLPSIALGTRRAGANDTISMGFIGVGGRGRNQLKVFLKHPDVRVAVVCDVNQRNGEGARKLTDGKADLVADYRRVLERKDIDAVAILTPDHWHAIPTIEACKAGKDVYVEKPMTLCIAEGRRMVQAAHKYQRVVQVGTQQASGLHYHQAAEFVQSGKLGKISYVEAWNVGNRFPGWGHPPDEDPPPYLDWDFWLGPRPKVPYNSFRGSPGFRHFWDYSGGYLTDWGTHHMESVQRIMNVTAPKSVCASGGKWVIDDISELPDTLSVLWEYEGWTLEYRNRQANAFNLDGGSGYGIRFHGKDGTLYIDRRGFEVFPEGDRIEPLTVGEPKKDNFLPRFLDTLHTRNFLDCVKSREKPVADVEIGQRATSVSHLGNIAYRIGRKIFWDAEKEEIIGDAQANRLVSREYRAPYKLPEV